MGIQSPAMVKIVGYIGLSWIWLGNRSRRRKNFEFNSWQVLFIKICLISSPFLWHQFSKKCGWFHSNLHHNKQITCLQCISLTEHLGSETSNRRGSNMDLNKTRYLLKNWFEGVFFFSTKSKNSKNYSGLCGLYCLETSGNGTKQNQK